MNLKEASKQVLDQVLMLMDQIRDEDYSMYMPSLDATVGQHVRHILEFYLCLFNGMETGTVNYDQRDRDVRVERDKSFARGITETLQEKIHTASNSRELMLEIKYGAAADPEVRMSTNFSRELAYNIEHTIHHLAIIKGPVTAHFDYLDLPDHFGIASSTVRHYSGDK